MASPTDLGNAHPGDVVVPLSDMLDLLESRLDEDELDELSEILIRRRTTEVAAGDVITAEMMNQMLADIANLQTRVTVLESGYPDVDAPQIVLVNPSNGVRLGDPLEVSGFNLDPEQLTSVRMGNRSVNVFGSASHDKLLVFNVPPILGIPEEGADVNLEITNDFGSDSIMVNVLRSLNTEFNVSITMSYQSIPSGALEANTQYTVTVRISALTSMSSEYIITPTVDNTNWSAVLADAALNRITIPQSQPSPFVIDVDVLVTTGVSGQGNVGLRIEAVGRPDKFGQTEPLNMEVGTAPEVNTDISFAAPVISPDNIDPVTGNIILNPGGNVLFLVNATLATAGSYTVTGPTIASNPGSVWAATISPPTSVATSTQDQIHQVFITLTLGTGAPVSTPVTQLQFQMSRTGSSEPPALFSHNIAVTA